MKKLLLPIVSAFLFVTSGFAQEAESLKATKGSFATELNVNLFQGELSFNNTLEQIKARYFTSDRIALRFGLSADIVKKNREESQPYGTSSYLYKSTRKSTTFALSAGAEYHFKGTNRLSPYIGAELCYSSKKSSQTLETETGIAEVTGAWAEGVGSGMNYPERGYNSFGVNLLAGFDFYVAKNFYVGYEFVAFGLTTLTYKQIEETSRSKTSTSTPSTTPNPQSDDHDFSFGPSLINGIRVGYIF